MSAEEAVQVYDKYVPPFLASLKNTLRFTPKYEPKPFPPPPVGGQFTVPMIAEFFGCGIVKNAEMLTYPADWNRYVRGWPSLDQKYKDLSAAKFWTNDEAMGLLDIRPPLRRLGEWFGCIPTSNVDAERAFSHMRSVDVPSRRSQSFESLRENTLARANRALLDELLVEALKPPRTAQAEGSSAASAP